MYAKHHIEVLRGFYRVWGIMEDKKGEQIGHEMELGPYRDLVMGVNLWLLVGNECRNGKDNRKHGSCHIITRQGCPKISVSPKMSYRIYIGSLP